MKESNKIVLKDLYRFIKPYKFWFILAAILNLSLISFNLLRTYYTEKLLDNATRSELSGLLTYLGVLLVLTCAALIMVYGTKYATGRFGSMVVRELRYGVFKRLSHSNIKEIDKLSVGDIISRSNYEMDFISRFLERGVPELLFQPLMFIAASVYMIIIDWKLFLICYSLSPIAIFLINKFDEKSAKYSEAYYQNLGEANGVIKECIDGITTIKTYNLSDYILSNCKKAFDRVLKSVLTSEKFDAVQLPFYFVLYESPKILCLLFGGLAVINGRMTIGQLIAYSQLILFVADPINTLTQLFGGVRKFFVAFKRVRELLDVETEGYLQKKYIVDKTEEAHLEFKNVSFSYDGVNPVLDDVSFNIPMGSKVAIVGLSGEGKSTILNLICGFYDVIEGDILINNRPYRDMSIEEIRSKLSYVSQETFLFPITISQNIGFGKINVNESEIRRAAEITKCHDFIVDLPNNYDTIMSEQGKNLSGGQRQRVSIARAVLKDAPIILMDEPTASLDLQTEAEVMDDILKLTENKTLIISTHRYSVLNKVDLILIVSKGCIIERGSHKELLQQNGVYHKLYNKQFVASEVI